MNIEIESTIKEITRSVIQFNADIEKNTPDGLTKFINEFEPLLKRYSDLMKNSKYIDVEHFLNFKDRISPVFDFLFTDSNIFKIAESSINQNEGITGTILAIGRNGNPLSSIPDNRIGALKKSIGNNPYLEFISIYKDSKDSTPPPQQIENQLIFDEKILDSFHSAFNGYLWKTTNIEPFKNWFRVTPEGMPDYESDMIRYFCYAVWKIEGHIIPEYRPKNLNKWFESIIGKNNYSGLKKSKLVKEKKAEIDKKLNLLT